MTLNIDGLRIRFPARPGYLLISRLNAAAVGSAAGFDVDELDDLKLAITEAATWLLSGEEHGGEVEMTLSATDGAVRIEGVRSDASNLPERRVDDLIEAILGATVDHYELASDGSTGRRITLLKRSVADDR